MWLSHLLLANFRNYQQLGLELEPGIALFCGENAQGKSNLLEAVHVLATTRSPRTNAERELIRWMAPGEELEPGVTAPFARIESRVRGREGDVHVEMLLKASQSVSGEGEPPPVTNLHGEVSGRLEKQVRVNGLPTRATELVGRIPVVYFSPEDVDLVGGSPSGRRKYLDIANSIVAPLYLRALQQYNRILAQRNHVLRQVRERRQPVDAVEPWTDQLVRTGAYLLRHRVPMVAELSGRAENIYRELTGQQRRLEVLYRSSAWEASESLVELRAASTRELAAKLRGRLATVANREVDQAVSLVGPHRDDLGFQLDGVDLNTYGSRGQQRLAVLALKLAEVEWMLREIGRRPLLLLDDFLSELDPRVRKYVLSRLLKDRETAAHPQDWQVWLTTTDIASLPSEFTATAQTWFIDAGTIRRA